MKNSLISGLFILLFSLTAQAKPEVVPELKNIGIEEKLGAQLDLNLKFHDEEGQIVSLRNVVDGRKPTLIFLVYYNCPGLCNFFLNGAVEVLKKVPMTPGKEFNILTVTMDPREDSALAKAKRQSYFEVYGRKIDPSGWRFWANETIVETIPKEYELVKVEDPSKLKSVRALADQIGFRYRYDKKDDQFAHAATMVVLTPEGKISRYLPGISFQPRDLRLALAEAGGGKIGTVVDRLLLFCFHYDPNSRSYALFVTNLMRAGAALTVLMIALGIMIMSYRQKKIERNKEKQNKSISQNTNGSLQ